MSLAESSRLGDFARFDRTLELASEPYARVLAIDFTRSDNAKHLTNNFVASSDIGAQ